MMTQYFNSFAVLEVYQFARDAAVAEAWLVAQEPYLLSQELGVGIRKAFLYVGFFIVVKNSCILQIVLTIYLAYHR